MTYSFYDVSIKDGYPQLPALPDGQAIEEYSQVGGNIEMRAATCVLRVKASAAVHTVIKAGVTLLEDSTAKDAPTEQTKTALRATLVKNLCTEQEYAAAAGKVLVEAVKEPVDPVKEEVVGGER